MGQQQLLLLILGIVIVALGVAVGIQLFTENQRVSNADAMTLDTMRIATDAQAWALKPTTIGGGGGAFTGLTFTKMGYDETAGTYENQNASVQTGGAGAGYTLATVTPGTLTIVGCNATRKARVETVFQLVDPEAITTTVSTVEVCL